MSWWNAFECLGGIVLNVLVECFGMSWWNALEFPIKMVSKPQLSGDVKLARLVQGHGGGDQGRGQLLPRPQENRRVRKVPEKLF